jgi:hypothetical protein
MPLRPGTVAHWGPISVGSNIAATIPDVGEFGSGGQQPSVRLQMNIAGYQQVVDVNDPMGNTEYYIVVDLGSGSFASPGDLHSNTAEGRGYYIHAVDVQMWFEDSFELDGETPLPSSAAGSGNNSASSSDTVGFFGTQLTASQSETVSHGGGRSFPDYEMESHSTHKNNLGGNEVLKHHFALKLCDGGPYHSPFSLVDSDHNLFGLPPRAVGNMPLVSAAAFKAVAPVKTMPPKAILRVSVNLWLANVAWWGLTPNHWFKTPDLGGQTGTMVGDGLAVVAVDAFDVTKGPGVLPLTRLGTTTGSYVATSWKHEFAWGFAVDYGQKKVVAV